MPDLEGDRPGGAPPAPKPMPNPGPPRGSSLDDPAKLTRAARMIQISLARQGLTYPDLRPPAVEHVRAA